MKRVLVLVLALAADAWVKIQQVEGGVNIHYGCNTISGAVDDSKFAR